MTEVVCREESAGRGRVALSLPGGSTATPWAVRSSSSEAEAQKLVQDGAHSVCSHLPHVLQDRSPSGL